MNKNKLQRGWESLKGSTPLFVSLGALAIFATGCNDDKNEKPLPKYPPLDKAIDLTYPPTKKFDAKYPNTLVCYKDKVKFEEGDTLFGITTQGLRGDEYFMNRVFAWNLEIVKKASEKKPALRDPNNIPIGTKFSIMTDCVRLGSVMPKFDEEHISPTGKMNITGYTRDAVYQNFTGTDGDVRHLVTVRYHSNVDGDFYDRKTDEPFKPEACSPSPLCYEYVPDAPQIIPTDVYLP